MSAAAADWTARHGPQAPCQVCGYLTGMYVDDVPRHLNCYLAGAPDPKFLAAVAARGETRHPVPGTEPDVAPTPPTPLAAAGAEPEPADPTSRSPDPADLPPTPTAAEPAAAGPPRAEQLVLDGPAPEPPERWRAAAAVFDPTGVYLPDGLRWPLPAEVTIADLLTAGDRLRIGHSAGVGALVLTDDMCVQLGLDLVLPDGVVGEAAKEWMRDALAAAGEQFLASAFEAGWVAPDGLKPETKLRRPAGDGHTGERAFDVVLSGYLWTFDRSLSTDTRGPMWVDPDWPVERQCAEIARRWGRFAQLLGIPWQGTPRQVGLRLLSSLQQQRSRARDRGSGVDAAGRDRGRVVTRACPRPTLSRGARWFKDFEPETTNWSRTPTEEELEAPDGKLWLHAYDRRAAYLAEIEAAALGYLTDDQPELLHLVGADAVAAAVAGPDGGKGKPPAGLYRLQLPEWPYEQLPPPHPAMRPDETAVVWTSAPTVELLCGPDDPASSWPGAGYDLRALLDDDAEAWVFPAQGRLLAPWAQKVRAALTTARADGDGPVADQIKLVYAALQGGFAYRNQLGNKHPEYYQPIWTDTIHAASRSAVWRRIRTAQVRAGRVPVGVHVDELVYLSGDPDPAVGAPMRDEGKIGQLTHKRSRRLTPDERNALADGVPALKLLARPAEGVADAGA